MAPMTTLRTRLIGTFLAVSVIALGGLGYVALRFSGAALTDAGKVKGQVIAERLTMQYDRFVSDIVSALLSVTHLQHPSDDRHTRSQSRNIQPS